VVEDINKKIYYLGENKDFSDRWLIKVLKENFQVILIKPGTNYELKWNADYIVNRLYVSAYERYNKRKIDKLLSLIKKLGKAKQINSSKGFLLEYNRIKQFKFFIANNVPFVPTRALANIDSIKSLNFPIVIKKNHSGRNKEIDIINKYSDLKKFSSSLYKTKITQELIKEKKCYRTEFIGDSLLTFPQEIHIRNNKLKFKYIPKIVKTPLSSKLIKKIRYSLEKIGVRVFSIEYFIKNNNISIIDFNLSSNYKPFLIKQKGEVIKKAWLNLFK